METSAKSPIKLRREPTQERAQRTIEIIYQATTDLLTEEEHDGNLTTNKIAERAGFSIGTLYQYFPTKEAIIKGLVVRDRERSLAALRKLFDEAEFDHEDVKQVSEKFIHFLMVAVGGTGQSPLRKAVIRMGWLSGQDAEIDIAISAVTERLGQYLAYVARRYPDRKVNLLPVTLYTTTRAVVGAIRSASIEKSELLEDPAFRSDLYRMGMHMFDLEWVVRG